MGLSQPTGIIISGDDMAAFRDNPADVCVHCTVSYLDQAYPQVVRAIGAGLDVVSTCEQLAYPAASHPKLAKELDQLAKERGVTVLGTGVNPGFVMDTLPILLTGACQEVRSIRVTRVVDTSQRRLPLQRKIGAGLTPAEFAAAAQRGTVRHVGLTESMRMIGEALGWDFDRVEEEIEPVIAAAEVTSQYIRVRPGQVAGVHQVGRGLRGGKALMTLELKMCLGATSCDTVSIEGTPPIQMVIEGGVQGDLATAGVVVNAIPRLRDARPGLITMLDLPLLHAF